MEIVTNNVNTAFSTLVSIFNKRMPQVVESSFGNPNASGNVLMINQPCLITYINPTCRVLLNPVRDANPFFHLYEALWMLAGRNDVAPLKYYNSRIDQFSDDGETLNGAYGYRWRNHYYGEPRLSNVDADDWRNRESVDQLDIIVNHLKTQPNSRRAVLNMWNVEDDLLKIGPLSCNGFQCGGKGFTYTTEVAANQIPTAYLDEHWVVPCETCKGTGQLPGSKDVCCNLEVMFSIRTQVCHSDAGPLTQAMHNKQYLDITVTNRSNDLIWGMLGANYVHFSMLQEYMAARIGVQVGVYHHFTNNLHVYHNRPDWKPEELLLSNIAYSNPSDVPLVKDPAAFEEQLKIMVHHNQDAAHFFELPCIYDKITEPFFKDVCYPMFTAYHWYRDIKSGRRRNEGDVEDALSNIKSEPWRFACQVWMKKRMSLSL